MWSEGSKLVHPFNPELGVGFVRGVEGRYLTVYFPSAEREVTMAAEGSGLEPLVLSAGATAVLIETGEEVRIAEWTGQHYRLEDGREVADAEVWPTEPADNPIERLAHQKLDRVGSWKNRIEGLRLRRLREAGGLGSFLGGRIELFPHQLHTALAAVRHERVRWLLADEVGLGKTIVACLILSALVRTGRAERALIITPSTLTVQWLGELYRKFHQIFVLLDEERIESVARDYGEGNNPFDVHPYAVISMEMLEADPRLARQAQEVDLDLVVIDEAHRLAGSALAEVSDPLIARAEHALLLTATPLSADRAGFFRLLSLLHPDRFPDRDAFENSVDAGEAVFPCTSAVRREDLGGLPPRRPVAVDLPAAKKDPKRDPRARWLADQVGPWLAAGEKALVFVHEIDALEKLKKFLESAANTHITVFHEALSPGQRDIEVARFRESNLPVMLCSEAGGEGRNFQFCDRMVHFDLPLDPVQLEQRIGRLDRIGRTGDVEIVYFRCENAKPDVAALYERLDLFSRPSAGLDTALSGVRAALQATAGGGAGRAGGGANGGKAGGRRKALDVEALATEVEAAREGAVRDLPRVLYSDAYDGSQAEAILALIPEELEESMRKFTLGASNDLGLKIVDKGGQALYYLEMGTSLTVETIPGVADESRWLGTFARSEAIEKDELDFFASGHPLVEGLLLEVEDGPRGRAAVFELADPELRGSGLLCVFKSGAEWTPMLMDARGELRPELAEHAVANLSAARAAKPEDWNIAGDAFAAGIRELAERLEPHAPEDAVLEAAAFVRFVSAETG